MKMKMADTWVDSELFLIFFFFFFSDKGNFTSETMIANVRGYRIVELISVGDCRVFIGRGGKFCHFFNEIYIRFCILKNDKKYGSQFLWISLDNLSLSLYIPPLFS